MSRLLVVKEVSRWFGGLKALDGVSLEVDGGEIVGLIGPNGSGKTTLVNCITGLIHANDGRIKSGDIDITKAPPQRIFRLGIARTFQTTRIYGNLTVSENLKIPLLFVEVESPDKRLKDVMDLTKLNDDGKEARLLTIFEQKKLEIASRLVTAPKMLILDEPAAGLSPEEGAEVSRIVQWVAKQGTGVLLIEHTMNLIFSISDKVEVLEQGLKIAEGTPDQVFSNKRVVESYLGKWRPPE